MSNRKKERYWDKFNEINDEWKKLLNTEHEIMKKEHNAYYNFFRSMEKMTEGLVYLISRDSRFMQDNDDEAEKEDAELEKEHEKREMSKRLLSAIGSLTEKQKKAIELYYFSKRNQKEIAKDMGCSQGNVSDILKRALTKMEKKLNK